MKPNLPNVAAPIGPKGLVTATPPDFSSLTHSSGILICNAAKTTCQVRDLPQLHQSDPAINAAMEDFLDPILSLKPIPKTDADGKVIVDAGGAVVNYTAAEMRGIILGVACFDTSIATVIHGALANRGKDAPTLMNRTAYFDTLKRWENFGLSRAQRQQVWQNYVSFLGQNKLVDGLASPPAIPQSMYFNEVVADIGGGVEEACDPYVYGACGSTTAKNGWASAFATGFAPGDFLTNEMIIDRLKAGYVTMIAYQRFNPEAAPVKKFGDTPVRFRFGGYHKVVFSGFQPGPYPLEIIDVGSGQRFRVRLSSNIGEMPFKFPPVFSRPKLGGLQKAPPPDPALVSFSEAAQRSFLIYESEDKALNPEIKFVDHYNGLKIARPPLKLNRTPLNTKPFEPLIVPPAAPPVETAPTPRQ